MDAKPFTSVDRDLLKRCLNKDPGSWNDFVDRFLSLIYHVIGYTAHLRSARLTPEDKEDIAAEVLLKLVDSNFKVLREFRGHASLATYLTVIARRIAVQELARRQRARDALNRGESRLVEAEPDDAPAAVRGIERLEEVERLLKRLKGRREREIVRLYYLEGRTYEEISTETDVPVNTIGAVLSRARKKLRELSRTKSGEVPTLKAPAPPRPPKPEPPNPPAILPKPPALKVKLPSPPLPQPQPGNGNPNPSNKAKDSGPTQ